MSSLAALTYLSAASANAFGARSRGGVLTQSLARWTAAATISARRVASLTALAFTPGPITVACASGAFTSSPDLYSSKA